MVAIAGRAGVEGPGPAVSLRRALVDEARRGVLAAMAVRALVIAASLLEAVLATIPSQHGRPHGFSIPTETILLWGVVGIVDLAFFIAALRAKAPLIWCFACMAVDLALFAEGEFFYFLYVLKTPLPTFAIVRYQDLTSITVIIAIYALPLSRRLVWITGGAAMAIWPLGVIYDFLAYRGGTLYWGPFGPGVDDARLRTIMDPTVLLPDYLIAQVILLGLLTAFLWMSVRASDRQIAATVEAENSALALARFFPPKVAAALTDGGARRLEPARRMAAILFVASPRVAVNDPAGFATLQAHYKMIEAAIFAQGGVIDRFTGAPIMGVFGAFADEPEGAERALACARSVIQAAGRPADRPAMALHAGEVVCGEMGDDGDRAYAVVGDAVHVARRMLDEAQLRSVAILVSAAATQQLKGSADLVEQDAFLPRGREGPVGLWALRA